MLDQRYAFDNSRAISLSASIALDALQKILDAERPNQRETRAMLEFASDLRQIADRAELIRGEVMLMRELMDTRDVDELRSILAFSQFALSAKEPQAFASAAEELEAAATGDPVAANRLEDLQSVCVRVMRGLREELANG